MKSEDVAPELLKACPSFGPDWHRLQAEGDDALLYVVLSDFARHLLAMKKEGREDVLRAAAEFIERMHIEGDDYVKEAATIGALEGIQNVWSHAAESSESFSPYLLEESRRWWDSLQQFWKGKIPYVGADMKKG